MSREVTYFYNSKHYRMIFFAFLATKFLFYSLILAKNANFAT